MAAEAGLLAWALANLPTGMTVAAVTMAVKSLFHDDEWFKGGKEDRKALSNFWRFVVENAPDALLGKLTGSNGRGLKCLVHYLNGSGKPLEIELSPQEWWDVLKQTKPVDWKNESVRNLLFINSCRDGISIDNRPLSGADEFAADWIDMKRLFKEMKPGEVRNITTSRGIPYRLEKTTEKDKSEMLRVFYDRKWRQSKVKGWDSMMGRLNLSVTMNAGTTEYKDDPQRLDLWNIFGTTTLLGRKNALGGKDYAFYEKFKFGGDFKSENEYKRSITLSPFLQKLGMPEHLKKLVHYLFPDGVKINTRETGVTVLTLDVKWIQEHGMPFDIHTSMYTTNEGTQKEEVFFNKVHSGWKWRGE
ncbi:MAG: hypothetical protein WC861_00460 [Candidatus Micrarchaeia archaeon]